MKLPQLAQQILNTPITDMNALRSFMGLLPSLMHNDHSGQITEMVKQTLDNIIHEEVQIARKERLENGVK